MLQPSTEQLLRAIVALKTRPEGQLFFDWLAQSERATLERLRFLDEERVLRREQGVAQLLHELNTIISSAASLLNQSR